MKRDILAEPFEGFEYLARTRHQQSRATPDLGPAASLQEQSFEPTESTILISDVLLSTTQQRILSLLYSKPDQSFYANEIFRWARIGKGGLMRELKRLHQSGILTLNRRGNQTHYQANAACPIYTELLGIVRKTFGVAQPLRTALAPLAEQLVWAFVHGSIAKGTAHAGSDIDLILIGDALDYSDLMERLLPVEQTLGRIINPMLYTLADWRKKKAAGNGFVLRVEERQKIDLIGGNPEGT